MPIEVAIWRIDEDQLAELPFSAMESEARLEQALVSKLSILSSDLMLIGHQVSTAHGKVIDLLAMDRDGNLAVIELKRHRTPREVVAQLLVAPKMGHDRADPELCEHLLHIEWIQTLRLEQAYWENGMYANQNTVTKLRNQFTLERLIGHFGLDTE